MALTSEVLVRLKATQTGSNDFGGAFTPRLEKLIQLTDGTGANNADILFVDERSVATGANDDIDVAGALTDVFGTTVASAELVALIVINEQADGTANTTDLTIGGGSNPITTFMGGTTPTIGPIKPGGVFVLAAGDAAGIGAITASTADILRIANSSGATNVYQIGILARTA